MQISGVAVDLNWFFQLIFTLFVVALGLLHIIKNTASKYFVVDDNSDDSSPPSCTSSSAEAAAGDRSMPGVLDESCAVCRKATTKHCSGCKKVKYCSEACQRSHWKSEHKQKCKDYKLSGKVNSAHSPASQGCKTLANGTSDIPRILFPYEEFVELYNWEAPGFPPCGLLNCGNSCFANVVLQCLAYTRPLVAYLLEKGHQRHCRQNDWCFLCEFQTHIERASQTTCPFSPINILSRLSNIGGNLGYGKQEDAHEFMRMAIDTMQSVCLDDFGGEKAVHPNSQETTLIQHIFGGHLQSQVICTKCNNVSNQFENMMDLTVEIHGDAASLEECLDQFTAKEWLHGDNMYKCDGCNEYVMAWKRLTVRRAPNILTIALKRFQSGRFGKLNKRVTFPETLDLRPYMSEAGDGNDVYKLYAVVVHLDMLNASFFGHYICYTKDFRGNWYRIDDCKVCGVELDEVLLQGAYMLLYSRVRARPSCLYPTEPVSKEDQGAEGVGEKMDSCSKKPVDNLYTEPVDMAGHGESLPSDGTVCKTAGSKEELSPDFNSEDANEDIDMVDFEPCTSASKEVIICSNGDFSSDQETLVSMQNNRMVSEVNPTVDTCSTELDALKCKPHSLVLNVENGCGANGSYLREGLMRESSTADSMETHNFVCDRVCMPPDAAVSAPRAANILREANYVKSECNSEVGEAGKVLAPSGCREDAERKVNGRNSSGAKLKPLFTRGFLEKPRNKIIYRPPAQCSNLPCSVLTPSNGLGKVSISNQNGGRIQDGEQLGYAYNCSSSTSFLGKQAGKSQNEDLMDASESDESVCLGNGGSGISLVTDDIITVIRDGRPLK